MDNPDEKDVGRLLDDAIKASGLTQYKVAQRLAKIRGVHPRSADQALRRIRRFGQVPTEEVARDLAEAFRPILELAPDHFYVEREDATTSFREAANAALAEITELQQRIAELERALGQPAPAKTTTRTQPRRDRG